MHGMTLLDYTNEMDNSYHTIFRRMIKMIHVFKDIDVARCDIRVHNVWFVFAIKRNGNDPNVYIYINGERVNGTYSLSVLKKYKELMDNAKKIDYFFFNKDKDIILSDYYDN
jgi:hypothetical protein